MRPSLVFERNRDVIRTLVGRFPATNPRVFGSVLHGTDREDSDLDLLVDAKPGATLIDLVRLEAELQRHLGIRVDLRTSGELSSLFQAEVLAEAQPV